jgi:hypothetical protein
MRSRAPSTWRSRWDGRSSGRLFWVCAVGCGAGRRIASRDEQAAARRQPTVDRQSSRAGRGILVLLLRCGRVGTLAISQMRGKPGLKGENLNH